jgi:hypothetical protein
LSSRKVFVGLALAVTLAACSHAPATAAGPALGERFPIRPGESVAIRGEPVTVDFQRILSDNRCAIDVVCIVGGEARGSFRVTVGRAAPVSLDLATEERSAAEVAGYRIALVGMTPAPRSTVRIAPQDYRAELVVTR